MDEIQVIRKLQGKRKEIEKKSEKSRQETTKMEE